MNSRLCAACAAPLIAEPHYARLCRPCFIEAKKRESADLVDEVTELRAEVARLRAQPAPVRIDPALLRWLLQHSHPDKHAGSESAKRATQWLLALREAERV